MESILYDDSPLAQALLEGDGTGESFMDAEKVAENDSGYSSQPEFAPTATGLQSRLIQKLGHPLRISVSRKGPVAQLKNACSDAVSSRLHSSENEAFLERFRYVVITSNLVSEQVGNSNRLSILEPPQAAFKPTEDFEQIKWTLSGAGMVAAMPAVVICMIRWCFSGITISTFFGRALFTFSILGLFGLLLFANLQRRRLKSLRYHAFQSVNTSVTNFRAFDQSSSAAITMIQEVEAVSRGYHLTNGAMPPVTLFEDRSNSQSRRCTRLRRLLHQTYTQSIPIIIRSCQNLKEFAPIDDVEKYMEIYEVSEADVQEAFSGAVISEIDDQESLRALRAMHLRFAILRRVLLCHILSLRAEGSRRDLLPWSIAVSTMDHLALMTAEWAERINSMIKEDDRTVQQVPMTPTQRSSPEKEKYRQQLRKANELAAELRTMQAKLFILRDDVSRILDGSGNLATIPTLFMSQSESLGIDVRNLQSTYDSWRTSILPPSSDGSKRISITSSGIRSPISLNGLWSVDEASVSNGKPIDALRILSGESSGSETSPRGGSADEEVFEAVGLPRVRRTMTREEKMNWMQEEEARRSLAREQRQVSGNVMRELESVIRDRKGKRMSTGAIPHGRVVSF